MSGAPLLAAHCVRVENGEAITNSHRIAEGFGKRHADVLRAIEGLLGHDADLRHVRKQGVSEHFREVRAEHPTVPGRVDVSYDMTRNGFALLGMGFQGVRALEFKLDLLAAMDAQAEALRQVGHEAAEIDRRLAKLIAVQEAATYRDIPALYSGLHENRARTDEAHEKIEQVEVRFEARVSDLKEQIYQYAKQQAPRRKAAEPGTLRLKCESVRVFYAGLCPACRKVPIIDEQGNKLAAAELDHWERRDLNGPNHTWLICRPCNRGLGTGKIVRHTLTDAFREALRLERTLPGAQLPLPFTL